MPEPSSDPFIASKVFPDAVGLFQSTHRSLAAVRDECLVVLDTNVLLVPYRAGQESLTAIGNLLRKIKAGRRLYVPGQVAREFAKNRAQRIGEIYQSIKRKRDIGDISIEPNPLLESLPEFRKLRESAKQLSEQRKNYASDVQKVLDVISGWVWNDPVSKLYAELFDSSVVFDPSINEKDAKERLARCVEFKLPPGYKDADKADGGIGDVLIWMTMLDLGQTHGRDLLFVSGEEKADWWYKSEKDALYPRYELVDEYRRKTNGKTLHIAPLAKLLELYGADSQIVERVQAEEKAESVRSNLAEDEDIGRFSLISSVSKWLTSNIHGVRQMTHDPEAHVDIVVERVSDRPVYVEVMRLSRSVAIQPDRAVARLLRESARVGGMAELSNAEAMMVVVLPRQMLMRESMKLVDSIVNARHLVRTAVGTIQSGEFRLLVRTGSFDKHD